MRRAAVTSLLTLALLSLPLGACRGEPEPGTGAGVRPLRGGTAVIGSTVDVDSWNEYLSRQEFAGNVLRRIYLRLADPIADGPGIGERGFTPALAESWTASDDGMGLTFRLRDASWSDGEPIDADDVVFSWRAQTSEEVAWIGANSKRSIETVEALDARTVRFRFAHRYPEQMNDAIEGGILPEHVFGAVPFERWRTHDWSGTPIGSGPFLLAGHVPSQEIRLVRNPMFHDARWPLLDGITIRIVPDGSSLVTQLLSGSLDFVQGLTPRAARRISERHDARLVDIDYPKYDYIGWNGARAPFDDPALRRAMTMAIDREALVETLLYGHGRVSHGPLMSWWWGVDESLEPLPYDPEAARQTLRELGYTVRDAGGELGPGEPLRVTIMSNAGGSLRESMLVAIQEQLARVGVEVRIELLEMRTLISRAMAGDYDAYLGGWTLLGSLDLRSIFGSASRPPNGSNVVFYADAELDAALDRIDAAPSWPEALDPLHDVQRIIHRDQPYSFLYESRRIAAVGPRLAGFELRAPDTLAGFDRAGLVRP